MKFKRQLIRRLNIISSLMLDEDEWSFEMSVLEAELLKLAKEILANEEEK